MTEERAAQLKARQEKFKEAFAEMEKEEKEKEKDGNNGVMNGKKRDRKFKNKKALILNKKFSNGNHKNGGKQGNNR